MTTEDATEAEIAEIRRETIDAAYRCVALIAASLARDHESCVRQSCRRASRCRRSVCLSDEAPA